MKFDQIEAERRRQGRSISELSRAAGVAYSTYWFIREGKFKPRPRTLERYQLALKRPVGERLPRARASADRVIGDLFRAYVVILAKELGHDAEAALAAEPQARANLDADWRACNYVRRLAVYCVTIELGVSGARVARAIGLTRAAVSQINKAVEDFREDPKVDALVERVGQLVSGRE